MHFFNVLEKKCCRVRDEFQKTCRCRAATAIAVAVAAAAAPPWTSLTCNTFK